MKGESALVGADVECFFEAESLGPGCGCGVVLALIQEGSGFLAAVGVEVEAEAVEAEVGAGLRALGVVAEERRGGWSGKAFELTDTGVGAFPDGNFAGQLFGQDFDADVSGFRVVEAFGEELHDYDSGVFVDDEAGEIVGFGEDETAGVGFRAEERLAAIDGGSQAVGELGEPLGLGDEFAGDEAQGDLRDGAVEGGAERDAAVVDYRNEGWWVPGAGFDLLYV